MQQPKTHLSLRVLPTSHTILINLSTRLSEWSHLKSSPMLRTMNHDLPCRICGLCFLLKCVRCFRWAFSASGRRCLCNQLSLSRNGPSRQQGYRHVSPAPDWLRVLSGFRSAPSSISRSVPCTRQPQPLCYHSRLDGQLMEDEPRLLLRHHLPAASQRGRRLFLAKSSVWHEHVTLVKRLVMSWASNYGKKNFELQ